jgi:CheY-like chemotaxis protein
MSRGRVSSRKRRVAGQEVPHLMEDGSAGRAPRARILIVEDDVHSRRIGALALGAAGHEIHEAVNGLEGVTKAASLRPDVIVMDMMLPGMSGIDAVERIRDVGSSPHPLIIGLSARAMRSDADAALAAGCDAYLTKPIDPLDLVAEIERLLVARRNGA